MGAEHPGELEQLILFAILRLGKDAYGVGVRRIILDRTGRSVSPGGIYTILGRLESRGLVSSRLGDETPDRGGRRKRLYTLTAQGADALERSYDALQAMATGVLPALRSASPEEA